MSMERHVAERPPDNRGKGKRPVPPVDDVPTTRPDPEVVPDAVLEELLAAFSAPEAETGAFDFDDPSIDRLLGLGDDAVEPDPTDATDGTDATELDDDIDDDEIGDDTGAVTSSNTVLLGSTPAADPPRNVIVIGDDDRPDALYLDE